MFYEDMKRLLSSRTVWTIALMFAFNAVQVFGHYLSPEIATFVDLCLTGAAGYFHVNPRISFSDTGEKK